MPAAANLNATSLPSPDSEAHGTMVERGDCNSIQFCKGGTSHSRLPSPRCLTLGQLRSSATLQPYLNKHQHQTHHRKEHIGLMLCLVPSSCTIINAVKKLEHGVDFTAMAEAQKTTKRWQHTTQPYLSWHCKTSSLGHQTLCSSAMFLPANHDLSYLPTSVGQSLI